MATLQENDEPGKPDEVTTHPMPEDSGTTNLKQVNSEASEPHSSQHVSEAVYPEPVSSEMVNSHPGASDSVVEKAVVVHSQQEVDALIHTQPVDRELDQSQPMNPQYDHTETINAEFDDSQPMDAEFNHSQPEHNQFDHSQPEHAEFDHTHNPSQLVNVGLAHLQPVSTEHVSSEPVGTEIVVSQPDNSALVDSQLVTPETEPGRRRKKKSVVWEHFTIETVSAGCRRACCKVCKQSFAYSTGSKVAGTSHLKRHIAKGACPVILRQQEKNQLTPYTAPSGGTESRSAPRKRRYRSPSSPYLIFDQDRCRHEIAKMIIMHDYPLHIVEHPGFAAFVQNLQPRFDMVSFNIAQGDCVATYLREKQSLQRFIDGVPGRVSLQVDTWTSSQTTAYVVLTAHVVDNDWKLHRRLLNVVMEPFPKSDMALSHAVATCLSDWGLEGKLGSITVDQQLSELGIEHLRALLSVKDSSILNGQLLIKSCIARTLSSMAQDVLAAGQETVEKIRASVKYVKTSESHEEKFLEMKEKLRVPSQKSLLIDNSTKWNTTYEMLVAAAELKEVFTCLDSIDIEYNGVPSIEDWNQVENISTYLKLLYGTAIFLTTKEPRPSNAFFHEVWKIQLELARAGASDDPFVSGLSKPLQDKFQKYWKNTSLVLAAGVAMDPRFKMKLVEFSFTKIFGEEAPVFIRTVDQGIHNLFDEYVALPLPLTPAYVDNGNTEHNNGFSDFDMYIKETTGQDMKSELDQYLDESLLPRVPDFDVLGWWNLNKLKYPTLSKMARDILTISLCTVPPESVFDTARKEMDGYRCSLRAETAEALICAKDWLQQQELGREIVTMAPLKMEL